MPVLEHGELQLFQSQAIENYLAGRTQPHPLPLIATENLLVNTDGVGAPHQCSLGAAAACCLLIYADARYVDAVIVSKATIAPTFSGLTPEQRAKDLMFALIKADINVPTENLLFKKITADELKPIVPKYYKIVENLLPDEGFVNGTSAGRNKQPHP